MNDFADVDRNYKAHVAGAGNLIFLVCYPTVKNLLK